VTQRFRGAGRGVLKELGRNDGTHVFADTLSEHNANVERWQRQYWRDRRLPSSNY
jgi:hypothetical protein